MICIRIVKRIPYFKTSCRSFFVCTYLNGLMYSYLTLKILFNINHLFAHS